MKEGTGPSFTTSRSDIIREVFKIYYKNYSFFRGVLNNGQ